MPPPLPVRATTAAAITAAVATFFAAGVPSTLASDYSNVCRSADGVFVIDDGVLHRAGDETSSRSIPFKSIREVLLSRETGYCVSKMAGGQRFNYEAKVWTQRVAFSDQGRPLEVDFICEFAADGLPAAYDCDEQVVVSSEAPANGKTADHPNRWMHNGSVMRLEASGTRRRFFYSTPRPGMRKVGVAPGTLLFDGARNGETYAGTAYIFARGCPPTPYHVEGRVAGGDRRVEMTGRAPRIGAGCTTSGHRDDELVFTFEPGRE